MTSGSMSLHWIGIDIGGTFTDLVLVSGDGQLITGKVLTTPENPALAVRTGLESLLKEQGIDPVKITNIVHGTTLVTNAIIERKGAKTALLTTQGFRDILEMGREKRFDLYDLFIDLPPPLVSRYFRREVQERVGDDGTVLVPLNEAQAGQLIGELKLEGVQSLAICYLHAFRNKKHEERTRSIAESAGMQFVSISSEVAPEIREYERASTTVANAYVQPVTKKYLAGLRAELADLGYRKDLFVMLSSGGIATSEEAERFPIRLIESGPAAGAVAASFYGALTQSEPILSFDMGGTTAKLCLIEKGKPLVAPEFEAGRVYRFKKGSGLPIRVPAVEMIEIGAGGGSIAHVDPLGLLKVGPESAGANPGPACYDLGGADPTVTDADLMLGYLDAGYFLGGKMPLTRAKAIETVGALGALMGLDLLHAAWGIYRVVNASMANAAQVYAAEKGRDLRRYTMVAFGGASPAHACAVADELGSIRVIVPFAAGVSSAFGLLVTRPSIERVRAYMGKLEDLDWDEVRKIYEEMEEEGRALLRRMSIRDEDIELTREAEMRYTGQRHQISIPIPAGAIEGRNLDRIEAAFKREYENLYQEIHTKYAVEALNWKVSVAGPARPVQLSPKISGNADKSKAFKGLRQVCFSPAAGYVECPIFDRYRLAPGSTMTGPAVIEEKECTTVVTPGWEARVDRHLDIILTKAPRGKTRPPDAPEKANV